MRIFIIILIFNVCTANNCWTQYNDAANLMEECNYIIECAFNKIGSIHPFRRKILEMMLLHINKYKDLVFEESFKKYTKKRGLFLDLMNLQSYKISKPDHAGIPGGKVIG